MCDENGDKLIVFTDSENGNTIYNLDGTEHADQGVALDVCGGEPLEFIYVPFDQGVHEDQGIVGDGSAGSPIEVPVKPCTKYYEESESFGYDMVLPDGSTLAAGDPLPAGYCAIVDENPFDNSFIDGQIIAKGSDVTINYVLFDETVHTDGGIVGNGSVGSPFEVPISCKTQIVQEGEPVNGDVTIDGSVVASGDPAPDGWIVIEEVNPFDGTVLESQPVKQTCSATYLPGETLPYDADYVDGDGNTVTLTQGDPVPDGVVFNNEETVGGDPISVKAHQNANVCDTFNEPSIVCDDVTNILASDGTSCGPINPCDLLPGHFIASCDSPGETLAPVGDPNAPVESDFEATFLDSGQIGDLVGDPDGNVATGIPAGTFPYDIAVPAATAGCVLSLHLSYGNEVIMFDGISITQSGSDVGTAMLVGTQDVNIGSSGPEAGQSAYLMDAITGGSGSIVTIDFVNHPEQPAQIDGVFTYHWTQICDTSDNVLNTSDFDFGAVQFTDADTPQGSATNGLSGSDSGEWDLGPCPAIVFAAGRHVASNPNNPSASDSTPSAPDSTDWWQENAGSGITELYDESSYNHFYWCQMGWSAAFVDGNVGPWDWTYTGNELGQFAGANNFPGGPNTVAGAMAIPLVSCQTDSGSGATLDTVNSCNVQVCNDNCKSEAVTKCTVNGGTDLIVPAGEKVEVTPTINGALITSQTFYYDNTLGVTEVSIGSGIAFDQIDLSNVLAPSECADAVVGFQVTNSIGVGSATIRPFNVICEVIHV